MDQVTRRTEKERKGKKKFREKTEEVMKRGVCREPGRERDKETKPAAGRRAEGYTGRMS